MILMIGLAVGLIIAGLVIMLLSKNAGQPILVSVVWWLGLALLVCGVLLLLDPIIHFFAVQVRTMLGQ